MAYGNGVETAAVETILKFVREQGIQTLNVAGPRLSGWVDGYELSLNVIGGVIAAVRKDAWRTIGVDRGRFILSGEMTIWRASLAPRRGSHYRRGMCLQEFPGQQ